MPNIESSLIGRRKSRFERSLMGAAATFVMAVVFGGYVLKLQRDEAYWVVRELGLSVDVEEEAAPVAGGHGYR